MENKTIKILLILLSVLFLFACSKDKNIVEDSEIIDGQKLATFNVKEMKKGEAVWTLDGIDAYINDDDEKANVKEPNIVFYEKKKKTSVMKADKAYVDMKTKTIDAKGHVSFKSKTDNIAIYADDMHYNNATKRITSPGRVKLCRDGTITTGRGFEATTDMSEINILNDVSIQTE